MISDGVIATRSFLLPSPLIADLGANKNMRLKGSDRPPRQRALHTSRRLARGSAQFAKRDMAALAARFFFRRKKGDPPDPGQHSVEIFLDDHTVNVRELLGDLDQRLA
jgi:hypothetical protein